MQKVELGLVFLIGLLAVSAGIAGPISGAAYGDWSCEVVDSTGEVGDECSIVLDGAGNPHISYKGDNGLRYAHWNGSEWITEVVFDSTFVTGRTSIALDDNGNPHISYGAYQGPSGGLEYTYWDGSGWPGTLIDWTDETEAGDETSLVLDDSGYPHIAYTWEIWAADTTEQIRYASYDGSSWNITVIDNVELTVSGRSVSLVLNEADQPHISYTCYDLMHAYWDGSEWNIEQVDTTGYAKYSSLALDSLGNPHIAYEHYYDEELNYAFWDGSDWQSETIVSGVNSASFYCSLALDDFDNPCISAYGSQDLKFFRWDGSSWIEEVVDSDAGVDHMTSLAIDNAGNCHIAYNDWYPGNLMYASGTLTGIPGQGQMPGVPGVSILSARPNPFDAYTAIRYRIDGRQPRRVSIEVYDVSGRKIDVLAEGTQSPGEHEAVWDGTTESGAEAASGLYFFRAAADDTASITGVVKLR